MLDQTAPEQLDIFAHSERNQYLHAFGVALLAQQQPAAEGALARLRELPKISGTQLSECGELLRVAADPTALTHDPIASLEYLRGRLHTLAQRCLGPAMAQDYQRMLLARVAESLEGCAWSSSSEIPHAAQLWLELEQPQRAKLSLADDQEWLDCPLRLCWSALLGEQLHESGAALGAWLRLSWIDADAAEAGYAQSVLLQDAWNDFCELDPPLETAWLGLWLELLGSPPLPPMADWVNDNPAAQALLQVQHTPRAQRSSIEFRARLRAIHPQLFAHWLARRG